MKRLIKGFLSVVILLLMINQTFIVAIGDSKSYQNQGGISFYGEYIFPEKPTLEKKKKVLKKSTTKPQKNLNNNYQELVKECLIHPY